MMRIWSLAVLIVGVWLLGLYGPTRPVALGLDAPVRDFSAARASATLGRVLGPELPHPVGSPENQAVRNRLIGELKALGLTPVTQTAPSCRAEPRWNSVSCATVTNVIVPVMPGAGQQILLMAHYDSVAAGPGACDDGCGMATLLETIRALKAGGQGMHPVTALFTDGEEAGLLGAGAWFRDPANVARTGLVINVDDRGNQGTSYLFQAGPGDAKRIDLYARVVPHVATSSLYGEIFKHLPNDTDMTMALQAGLTGYNFGLIGDVAQYHTALDRRANIDPASLQQHGEAVLALTRAVGARDFESLKGDDAIYLDVLGHWLPRLPKSWALPLSVVCFLLIALAGWLTPRRRREQVRPVLSFLMPPALLIGSVAIGYVLHGLAAWISGNADPSFAHPLWLRLSFGAGAFAVALLASRMAGAICVWLWFAGLAIATAILAPGASPYFLFPALVAAPLLLVTVRGGRGLALLVAALAVLVIWMAFAARVEVLLGLHVHQAFMAVLAVGLMPVLPLLARARDWGWSFVLSLVTALVLAVVAGLQPPFSDSASQRLDIRYVEQGGKAWWMTDPVAHLPQALRDVAPFSAQPEQHFVRGYAAAAGKASYAVPSAHVTRDGDVVRVSFQSVSDGVVLRVPESAQVQSVTFHGVTVPGQAHAMRIACVTPDCGSGDMTLRLASPDAQTFMLASQTRGLPPGGEKLLAARPVTASPSQDGDVTLLTAAVAVPRR